jgi:hypothetical protein
MNWWNYITGGSDQYVQRTFDNFKDVQRANELISGTKPDYVKPGYSKENNNNISIIGQYARESIDNGYYFKGFPEGGGYYEQTILNGKEITSSPIENELKKQSVEQPYISTNENNEIIIYSNGGTVSSETKNIDGVSVSTDKNYNIIIGDNSEQSQQQAVYQPQSLQQEVGQPQSQSVETAQEETELKSTTIFNEISNDYNDVQKEILKTASSAYEKFNPIPGDANKNGGEINYAKKVSLNVAPISKLNIANGMSDPEWSNRLGYILGNEGILKDLFQPTKGIVFPYTPDIDFQHNVNYERTEILHSNLAISHYKNTPPPNITLIADFTADGEDNARYMYGVIHFLRSISKCEFGESMLHLNERKDYAGVPPPVLYLNGWGNFMNNIPVVVKSFGIKLGKDKHYVEVNYGKKSVWLPTDISITIQMEIQFNLDKYKLQFDLNKYKENTLGYGIDNIKGKQWFPAESTYNIVGNEIIVDSDGKKTETQNVSMKNQTGIFESYKGTRLNGSGWTW